MRVDVVPFSCPPSHQEHVAARGLGSASRRLLAALLELGAPDSGSAQRASHAAGVLVPYLREAHSLLPRPNTASRSGSGRSPAREAAHGLLRVGEPPAPRGPCARA